MISQNDRREKVAKHLAFRKRLLLISVAIAFFSIPGFLLGQYLKSQSEDREAFEAVQSDYIATWCTTFGSDAFDITALDIWREFIDRNREFLYSIDELKVTDAATGKISLDIEYQLGWLSEDYYYVRSDLAEMAPGIFSSTHHFFAEEKNELGSPLPIACN